MAVAIEQNLTKIFKQLNPNATGVITAKNHSRKNTNHQSILQAHKAFEIWYVVNDNYVNVGSIRPHQLILCTDRLPIEIQIQILKSLYQFTNQSLHDQLQSLNLK